MGGYSLFYSSRKKQEKKLADIALSTLPPQGFSPIILFCRLL
jgi:hypothetical protein